LKYILIENKQRCRLDLEVDVWVQLFSIKPDFINWSLESKHIHLICYMPSSMERVKWKISFNYGIFKCYSLKQLLFSQHGVYCFDFFLFIDDLHFLLSEMLLKMHKQVTIHFKYMWFDFYM
jgi:hypothetical protein